jgi:hypothetical protein
MVARKAKAKTEIKLSGEEAVLLEPTLFYLNFFAAEKKASRPMTPANRRLLLAAFRKFEASLDAIMVETVNSRKSNRGVEKVRQAIASGLVTEDE